MVRKVHNINVSVVTADGSVNSAESWFSRRQAFQYAKNRELIDEYARQSDPTFLAKERIKRKFELVEARRKELEELQRKVSEEMAKLDPK